MKRRDPERFIRGCSIGPGKVCLYSIPERWIVNGRSGGSKSERLIPLSPEEKQAANTRRVVSRYWQAVGWLWIRSRSSRVDLGGGRYLHHRQGLLTLTLPGVATADHKAVKALVLDPFFTYCRNVLGLRDYVWVAELQPKSRQIHFHVIVNQFLPKAKIRRAWNDACDRSGVITMANNSRPSTEIEECESYDGSRMYAYKYMAKGLESGEIVGRIWSGSHTVTGIKTPSTNEVDQAFDVPRALAEVERSKPRWRQYDHGIRVGRFDLSRLTYRQSPVLYNLFRRTLKNHDQPPPPHVAPVTTAQLGSHAATDQGPRIQALRHQCITRGSQMDRPSPQHHHSVPTGTAITGRRGDHITHSSDQPAPYRQGDLWQSCDQ